MTKPKTEDKRLRSDADKGNDSEGAFNVKAASTATAKKNKTAAKTRPAATKSSARQRSRAMPDEARRSKGAKDRSLTEDRQLSDEERLDMFRSEFSQAALTDIPHIPGYHVCWLTTTNPRDSVAMRTRLGYEPVTLDDVPGWDHATIKTGEYSGLIGVNEMLAYKLPLPLYERYMKEAHHDAPMREQEKLTANVDTLKESAESQGAKVVEFDGMEELRAPAPSAPTFASEGERNG